MCKQVNGEAIHEVSTNAVVQSVALHVVTLRIAQCEELLDIPERVQGVDVVLGKSRLIR